MRTRAFGCLIAVAALALVVSAGCAATPARPGTGSAPVTRLGPGMMWGATTGPGIMRGYASSPGPWNAEQDPGPGQAGFVAGTPASPRVVRILAGPGYAFAPSDVRVAAGETVTFVVTTMGPEVHEFKVGRLADVAADSEAAPEIADIGMMQTKSLTYTFSGPGPFGFACHEPGHFEAGMRGTVTVIG